MKLLTRITFLLLSSLWSLPALAEPLTLERAVALARDENPAIHEAQSRIEQARAAVVEARAPFYPQVGAYAEYLRGDAPSAYLFKTIDARRLPPDVDFNDPGTFANVETGVRAQMNLFRGGGDRLRLEQAHRRVEVREDEFRALENELSAAVIDTWFALLSARELHAIARQSVAAVERETELAEVRFEGGALLRSELLSLQVRLWEARTEEVRSEGALLRLEAALAALLGLPADTPLAIRESKGPDHAIPADFPQALERARKNRPELAVASRQREIARLERGAARAEFFPRLDLESHIYHGDPGLDFDGERINWTIGAVLSWEIFSGFASTARKEMAAGAAIESAAAERSLLRQVELEVRSAWVALQEAEVRLEVTRAAQAQAEEAFALVRTQFEGGAVDVTRYLDAEVTLSRSRAAAAATRRDRQRAAAELARAVGERTY
jgi:outer membrane protein